MVAKALFKLRTTDAGLSADDLPLAMSRHATSKIDGSDLLNIQSFGFRGEALPSLGAVGKLTLTSRTAVATGAELQVNGGKLSPVRPAAMQPGTRATLRDLFYATPARLKFLRSDRAEAQAIADVVKRLAMAEPTIAFSLRDTGYGPDGLSGASRAGRYVLGFAGPLGSVDGPVTLWKCHRRGCGA